ncbi:hypothetical protein CPB85DRAFT_1432905 [Mucidula mucida]|nr:hypothetical protein CPB85DRAFT_1432905 [Mucidula mucida]
MAPNLQGLNIVLPAQSNLDSQDLLPSHSYPDISAQLALWTDLPFDSDESPVMHSAESGSYSRKDNDEDEELQRDRIQDGGKSAAIHDGHVNVITGTALPDMQSTHPSHPNFDLNAILSGFGAAPPTAAISTCSHISPSLAQLLLYSSQNPAPHMTHTEKVDMTRAPSEEVSSPPAKRARTRKTSISTAESPSDMSANPLSAAEDKRRRNTAASARFRMKKKEREAALEGKSKELEQRVNELERECEGLRRENGWLKGLVVGVTGAAQGSTIPTGPGKRAREADA